LKGIVQLPPAAVDVVAVLVLLALYGVALAFAVRDTRSGVGTAGKG
jgi:hypothetical protein